MCAGMHFANASLFMIITTALATLKIGKALDDEGKEITPALEFVGDMSR